MRKRVGMWVCGAFLAVLTGCESPMFENTPFQKQPQRTSLEVMKLQTTQDQLLASVQKMDSQLDEMRRENTQLRNKIAQLESRMATVAQTRSAATDADIAALRRDLQQTRAENATMRKQIADDLASRIDKMAKQQEAAARQSAPRGGSSASTQAAAARGSGYEHKVERGQTLTEIARGYGVPMQSIIKANNLKPPYNVRVGQVLFIPDQK